MSKAPFALLAVCIMLASCASTPTTSYALENQGAIRSGTFELGYSIEGAGPAVIVVGFPTYYRRIFSDDLRAHYRMVFVDHRVSAALQREVDPSEADLSKLIDDIELVRQELNLGRVAIMGHSGHGYMALEYAKAYPDHVSHVVMIGVGADTRPEVAGEVFAARWQELASPERVRVFQENLARITDEELGQLSPSDRMIRTYVGNGPVLWYDFTFDSTPLWEGVHVNVPLFEHVWGGEFARLDVARGLDGFEIPVLVALGLYDFGVAPSSWDNVTEAHGNFTILVFDRSGHTPPYEQAEEFDRELLAWMEATR